MGIKNLGLALTALAALGGTPDKSRVDKPETDRSAVTAPEIAGAKQSTEDQVISAYKVKPDSAIASEGTDSAVESGDSPEARKALIAKIQQECPDPAAMIAQREPELHALLKAEHPQLLQASVVGGLLETLYTLVKLLYGVVGAEGTIIIIILMSVFGVGPVLKKGYQLGKWTVDKAGGRRKPEELGEVIPRRDLPALNAVLSEVVTDPAISLAALEPGHRGDLNTHYDYIVAQFDNLRFEEKDEGIGMFKLAIKERYLNIRLSEILTALNPGAPALAPAQRTALEAELTDLIPKENRINGEIASNPFKVASVRQGREAALTRGVKRKVADAMRPAGRSGAEIKGANKGVEALVTIPRLYKIDSNLREIRILENKLKIWRGRYDAYLRIAGPGVAAPAAGASVDEQQRYQQAQAFIAIYEAMQTTLRDKQDERAWYEKAGHRVESILSASPWKRTLSKLALAAGIAYGATWGIRGASAAKDAIWPPELPAPTAPSEADKVKDQLEKDKTNKIKDKARRDNKEMEKDDKASENREDDF